MRRRVHRCVGLGGRRRHTANHAVTTQPIGRRRRRRPPNLICVVGHIRRLSVYRFTSAPKIMIIMSGNQIISMTGTNDNKNNDNRKVKKEDDDRATNRAIETYMDGSRTWRRPTR